MAPQADSARRSRNCDSCRGVSGSSDNSRKRRTNAIPSIRYPMSVGPWCHPSKPWAWWRVRLIRWDRAATGSSSAPRRAFPSATTIMRSASTACDPTPWNPRSPKNRSKFASHCGGRQPSRCRPMLGRALRSSLMANSTSLCSLLTVDRARAMLWLTFRSQSRCRNLSDRAPGPIASEANTVFAVRSDGAVFTRRVRSCMGEPEGPRPALTPSPRQTV